MKAIIPQFLNGFLDFLAFYNLPFPPCKTLLQIVLKQLRLILHNLFDNLLYVLRLFKIPRLLRPDKHGHHVLAALKVFLGHRLELWRLVKAAFELLIRLLLRNLQPLCDRPHRRML